MILTTNPDVLLVIVVMFAAGTAASHLLFRKWPLARAIARVGFLILLTIALLYAGIVPYQPLESTGVGWHDAAQAVLRIAWWLWMAWFLVGFLRAFVIVERRPREGKLLQDLLAGLIYLAALFAIVSYVFDLPIRGLLATALSPSSSASRCRAVWPTFFPASSSVSAVLIDPATGSASTAAPTVA